MMLDLALYFTGTYLVTRALLTPIYDRVSELDFELDMAEIRNRLSVSMKEAGSTEDPVSRQTLDLIGWASRSGSDQIEVVSTLLAFSSSRKAGEDGMAVKIAHDIDRANAAVDKALDDANLRIIQWLLGGRLASWVVTILLVVVVVRKLGPTSSMLDMIAHVLAADKGRRVHPATP